MSADDHLDTDLSQQGVSGQLTPIQLEFHQLELSYQGLRSQAPKQRARLTASLSEHGQQSPVLVVKKADQADRYVLIDGYQRVPALKRLGHDTVSAVVLALDEVSALCLAHRLEATQQRSTLEQGWLLQELVERHGLSQLELGVLLGHSSSWVSRRIALVHELPEAAQELVRRGLMSPHGAMRHLVPLARAKRSACERLIAGLGKTPVSARQLGRLSLAWQSASAEERKRIEQRPLLYLRVEEAVAKPGCRPPSPIGQLRKDLDALVAIAHRVCRRLYASSELGSGLSMTLDRAWQQALRAFDEMQQLMEERRDAGSGHEESDLHAQEEGPREEENCRLLGNLQEHGQGGLEERPAGGAATATAGPS